VDDTGVSGFEAMQKSTRFTCLSQVGIRSGKESPSGTAAGTQVAVVQRPTDHRSQGERRNIILGKTT
jgi:hypothetical protein